jgi:SAM-dependent methyltransferase
MGGERARLVDRALETAVAQLLRHDDRVRGLDVRVRFDGRVAHVDGEVAQPRDVICLRELIAGLSGVLAVWDRVSVHGRRPRVVDLGCGETKQHSASIGVDRRLADAVDVVADIEHALPVASASVDHIFAIHVLEHLLDYLPVLEECHRALRPGGVLHVMAPHWRHVNAVADPTHVRLFDAQTFKHFCVPRPGRDAGRRAVEAAARWYPVCVSTDGASVFADLMPVKNGLQPANELRLAQFFD